MNVITCFSIEDNYITMLTGYLTKNNSVSILYFTSYLIDKLKYDKNDRINLTKVIKTIISESKLDKKYLSNIIVLLSPKECNVYDSCVTNATSESDSIIRESDIRTLHIMASKKNSNSNQTIIDIIPTNYELSNGSQLIEPPIAQKTESVKMNFKFYCCENNYYNFFKDVFHDAGYNNVKFSISYINSINRLLLKNKPEYYFLLDVKENSSILSLIAKNSLIKSCKLDLGLNMLYNELISKYDLTYKTAKEIINKYGIDNREYNFKINLLSNFSSNDNNKHFYVNELNKTISQFIKNYFDKINESIIFLSNFTKMNQDLSKTLTMIICGQINYINNMEELIKKYLTRNVIFYKPNIINISDPIFLNSYVAILNSKKFYNQYTDKNTVISEVKRGI